MDKAAGLIKRERLILPQTSPATSVASWNKAGEPTRAYSEPVHATSKRRLEVMNIPKPQTEFKDLIDNSNKPFVPLLTTKPNALRPLSASELSGTQFPLLNCALVHVYVGKEGNSSVAVLCLSLYVSEMCTIGLSMGSQLV